MSSDTATREPKFPSTLAPKGSAHSHRNIVALLPALTPLLSLPATKRVLEFGSGADAVHVQAYAAAFPQLEFQPTECDQYGVDGINKSLQAAKGDVSGVLQGKKLDVLEESDWDGVGEGWDLAVVANCIHMMPYPEGPTAIFRHLASPSFFTDSSAARFAMYGPFRPTAATFFSPSDQTFDDTIGARPNPYKLGLRPIDELSDIAEGFGWKLLEKISMPNGNWVLVWGPKGTDGGVGSGGAQ